MGGEEVYGSGAFEYDGEKLGWLLSGRIQIPARMYDSEGKCALVSGQVARAGESG